jgi:TonB family protein
MHRRLTQALLICSIIGALHSPAILFAQPDQSAIPRKVLSKVAPSYPDLARKANAHGLVRLRLTVEPDGKVSSAEAIGGNPVLVKASLDAVLKWKFAPKPQTTKELIELTFDGN